MSGQTFFHDALSGASGGAFSGVAQVVEKGATIFSHAAGFADVEWEVPNSASTRYRIASISKPFTSVLLMRLCEQGLLAVEAAVGEYLKEIPDDWRPLTIHHLLRHTSGLMHGWALEGFRETMAFPQTYQQNLKRYFDKPLLKAQGEEFHYSGLGYNLLAWAAEEVSGMSFNDCLRKEILDPLGLGGTCGDDPASVLEGRASGYSLEDGELLNAPAYHTPLFTGGGHLISTAPDLIAFHAALQQGQLLSPDSFERMYTPGLNQYGYGWFIRQSKGRRQILHGGGLPGFSTFFVRYPEEDVCVAVLSNVTAAPSKVIAAAIGDVVFGGWSL